MSDPAVLSHHARLVAVGLAGVAAVAAVVGFIMVAIMLASLPFVFLGGLGLIIAVVLIVSVSGVVAIIGATLFFLARSGHARISDEHLRGATGFVGSSLEVLHSYQMY